MAITQFQPQNQEQNQNISQAPILGQSTGIFGQGMTTGQRTVSPQTKGSGRFTNLQSYLQANEPISGELNPNARLIQQRVQEAQTGAQTGLGQFQSAQQQAQKGLEGIRERSQFVESAFKSPEEFIKQTPQLERFTALRTGKEIIPTAESYISPLQAAQQQLQSTRQNIATGLQADITGGGLQEYLRQQRIRPELATKGETQLDRFIAEQTPGGIAQTELGRRQVESLRALQPANIAAQEELARQVGQLQLTTPQAIQSQLEEYISPQRSYLQDLSSQAFVSPESTSEIQRLQGLTREQYLAEKEPTRLSRIQALGSLAGQPIEGLGEKLPQDILSKLSTKETGIKQYQSNLNTIKEEIKNIQPGGTYDPRYRDIYYNLNPEDQAELDKIYYNKNLDNLKFIAENLEDESFVNSKVYNDLIGKLSEEDKKQIYEKLNPRLDYIKQLRVAGVRGPIKGATPKPQPPPPKYDEIIQQFSPQEIEYMDQQAAASPIMVGIQEALNKPFIMPTR